MKKYEYKITEDYVSIYLQNKKKQKFTIIIDTSNLEFFTKCNFSWNVSKTSKQYYVIGSEYMGIVNGKARYKTHYLHRDLVNATRKTHVDHINHNTLDNRIENLNVTTTSINNKNRGVINSNNKTGYRNVSFINGKYVVQLQIEGENKVLGRFDDANYAGEFAEEMRQKYYGKFSGVAN